MNICLLTVLKVFQGHHDFTLKNICFIKNNLQHSNQHLPDRHYFLIHHFTLCPIYQSSPFQSASIHQNKNSLN